MKWRNNVVRFFASLLDQTVRARLPLLKSCSPTSGQKRASIGYHRKRVVLYNVDGFWDSLLALLADLKAKGVMRDGLDRSLPVATSIDELQRIADEG